MKTKNKKKKKKTVLGFTERDLLVCYFGMWLNTRSLSIIYCLFNFLSYLAHPQQLYATHDQTRSHAHFLIQ